MGNWAMCSETPFQSFGFQNSYNIHKQGSLFWFNEYDIDHESVIFQT